jgi:2-phosphoglycerate kinase
VHLLPGALSSELADHPSKPLVVEGMLSMADEELHGARLLHRLSETPARDGSRHLRHFESIRLIQVELRRLCRTNGTDEQDVSHPEELIQRVVDRALQLLERPGRELVP